jgi:hypothetical protein
MEIPAQTFGPPQTAHFCSSLEQSPEQVPADEAGGTGEKDLH